MLLLDIIQKKHVIKKRFTVYRHSILTEIYDISIMRFIDENLWLYENGILTQIFEEN